MSAVQQAQRFHFGTARLYAKDATGRLYTYGQVQDVTVDIKSDLKAFFGEGNFPFAVADGHRSIDITAKHYMADLSLFGLNMNAGAPAVGTNTYVIDEVVTVATHAYTLQHTTGAAVVSLTMVVNGDNVVYQQVTAGSEAVGVSFSVAAGVLTFATGETATTGLVTYTYTTGTGTMLSVASTYQNSATPFVMTCIKRDKSPIDGSLGLFVWEFLAVRPGELKGEYKEGDATLYEQTFQAYANPQGQVLNIRAMNE